jgi:polyisoprenoid-binding protein YceI
MKTAFTAAALLIAASATAQAVPVAYTLDPAHVSVAFVVNHMGYSNVIGRFNTVSGDLSFDKDAIEASKLKVVIETASVDTNHAKRDEHLRSPDFFNAKEFPQMTFVSRRIERTGERTGTLVGDLTLLGVTKAVALDAVFNKDANSPVSKKDTVGFSARGKIKRTEFGMKYGAPGIGDEIELMVEAEAVKQ